MGVVLETKTFDGGQTYHSPEGGSSVSAAVLHFRFNSSFILSQLKVPRQSSDFPFVLGFFMSPF